jgi:hypothetical protein
LQRAPARVDDDAQRATGYRDRPAFSSTQTGIRAMEWL